MRARVLAKGFLEDLVAGAGGPFVDADAGASAHRALVVKVGARSPLRGLTSGGTIYAHAPGDIAAGVAQSVLMRSGVGHRDGDVTALASMLFPGMQVREHDSDAIPVDIDS